MGQISDYMGLRLWTLGTDAYDNNQLAGNFAILDQHDHSPGKGAPLTALSLGPGSVGTTQLANGSVTLVKAAADLKTDYSYIYGAAKTVIPYLGGSASAAGAGPFVMSSATGGAVAVPVQAYYVYYLDPADWAAGSRTPYFRMRGFVATNAVAATTTLTFGLYPAVVSYGASASVNTYSASAAVAGSTVSTAALTAASTTTPFTGPLFTLPSAGPYLLGFSSAGTLATGATYDVRATLQAIQQ